jgi:hypothetical protein
VTDPAEESRESDSTQAPSKRNGRSLTVGVVVFLVSLPIMYKLGWPALATVGLYFWVVPGLITAKAAPVLMPPLGAMWPAVNPIFALFAALASLQNALLVVALMRATAMRRIVIAATVVLLLPGIILLGSFAARTWVPPRDRSAEIEKRIRSRYESEVTDLKIHRVKMRQETDVPWSMTYTEWGYEVEYRLAGVPLTFRWRLLQSDDLAGAPFKQPGVRDPEYSGLVRGVFPDEVGLTEAEFKAVLNAYAEGSGQTEFGYMVEDDPWADVGAKAGSMSFAVWRRAFTTEPTTADPKDKYLVDFDLASREASYSAGPRAR